MIVLLDTGKSTHDARLVAAMRVHQVTHILTFNIQDFTRYPGINILSPQAIAESE
jgi:predicted nucleic acid-binding protein